MKRLLEYTFPRCSICILGIVFVLALATISFVKSAHSAKERDLLLPFAPQLRFSKIKPVIITISRDGRVQVDGEGPFGTVMRDGGSPSELEFELREIIDMNSAQTILISPDPKTAHQAVMDVLNACTGAGVRLVYMVGTENAGPKEQRQLLSL